jgi:hypothetical protein
MTISKGQLWETSFGDWTLTRGYELCEIRSSQDALCGETVFLGITLSYDEARLWSTSVANVRGYRVVDVLTAVVSDEHVVFPIGKLSTPVSVKTKSEVVTTTTVTVVVE